MARKTFTVELYKGANADKSYKRLNANHVEADEIFVEGYQNGKHQQLVPAFTMKKSSIVVPNRPIDFDISSVEFYNVYNCNYLAVYDESKTNVWFGFIDSIDYLNEGTARISWSVDFWATYRNKIFLAQKQFVQRALYMPKEFMLDSRRTVDPSLPTDEKNKLQLSKKVPYKITTADDDSDDETDVWYLFYLMPRLSSAQGGLISNEFEYPSTNSMTYSKIAGYGNLEWYKYLDKKAHEGNLGDGNEVTIQDTVNWNQWDSSFKLLTEDKAQDNTAEIQAYAPEIYATTNLAAAYKIDFIGGEGLRIVGCEVRRGLDLNGFKRVDGGYEGDYPIYHYEGDYDDIDQMIFEHDNLPEQEDFSYENIFDANSVREEISVGEQKVKLNPALRMSGEIGWHFWDSILPGFKPFYSFYKVNGMIAPVAPWQADESSPAVLVDADRSVPIYADQNIAYYLSHQNRINSEIQKQLIVAKANVNNSQNALENALAHISQEYDVSELTLENAVFNSTRIDKESNQIDKDQLEFSKEHNTDNLLSNTDLGRKNLKKSNNAANINLSRSQEASVKNLQDSNDTAYGNLSGSTSNDEDNLKRSNSTATKNLARTNATAKNNLSASQGQAESNLSASQKVTKDNLNRSNSVAQSNLKAGNDNQVDIQNSSVATQKDNLDLGTALSKSNTGKSLDNSNKNLGIQKAESFVTGLNLTAGLAKFLTGALYSAATGFLTYDIGTEINGNNADLSKALADDSNTTSKKQMDNSLALALSNLQKNFDASLAQMKASQKASVDNLADSQGVASSNLSGSNSVATSNLKASQKTSVDNLADSQATALKNLEMSNAFAVSNLKSSQDTSLANLKRSNDVAVKNLATSYDAQFDNFNRDYQKAVNSINNGSTIANQSLDNALKKALMSLNYGNDLSKVSLDNSTLKAVTLAIMDADLAQVQQARSMVASVEAIVNGLDAQFADWGAKGNSVQAVSGDFGTTKILKKLTPHDNIYSVQDHTKRQLADYIYTNGTLVNRKIALDQLTSCKFLWDGNDHEDYLGNVIQDEGQQYVQTEKCRLQGLVPQEALSALQSAFDSGVYVEFKAMQNPVSIDREEKHPIQKDEAKNGYDEIDAKIEIKNV